MQFTIVMYADASSLDTSIPEICCALDAVGCVAKVHVNDSETLVDEPDGVVVVFNANDKESFDRCKQWLQSSTVRFETCTRLLIGLGCRATSVCLDEAVALARVNAMLYVETASISDQVIRCAFEEALAKMVDKPRLVGTCASASDRQLMSQRQSGPYDGPYDGIGQLDCRCYWCWWLCCLFIPYGGYWCPDRYCYPGDVAGHQPDDHLSTTPMIPAAVPPGPSEMHELVESDDAVRDRLQSEGKKALRDDARRLLLSRPNATFSDFIQRVSPPDYCGGTLSPRMQKLNNPWIQIWNEARSECWNEARSECWNEARSECILSVMLQTRCISSGRLTV